MDALFQEATLRLSTDGRLPPRKPPTKPVKLGSQGDRKAAGAFKPVRPSDMPDHFATAQADLAACPAQQGRPDFADDIDRIVEQLLADGDVRWTESRGFHAPRRSWRFAMEGEVS